MRTPLPLHHGPLTRLQRFTFQIRQDQISPSLQPLTDALRALPPWRHQDADTLQAALHAKMRRYDDDLVERDWVIVETDRHFLLGQLENTDQLQPGDTLQLVQALPDGSPLQPLLAILRPRDHWLWLSGELGSTRQQNQRGLWLILLLILPPASYSFSHFLPATSPRMGGFFLLLLGMVLFFLRDWRKLGKTLGHLSQLTEQVWETLQVPEPGRFSLSGFQLHAPRQRDRVRRSSTLYDFGQALQKHRQRLRQE